MNCVLKRIIDFCSKLNAGSEQEGTPHFEVPFQPVIALAALVCTASLTIIFLITRPVVQRIGVWWIELLVYSTVPVLLTLVILGRSGFHREAAGLARVRTLLLTTFFIWTVVLIVIGGSLFIEVLFSNGVFPRGGGR